MAAASVPERMSQFEPICFHCHESSAILQKCAGCLVARYCNQECQSADWLAHKKVCLVAREPHINLSRMLKIVNCERIQNIGLVDHILRIGKAVENTLYVRLLFDGRDFIGAPIGSLKLLERMNLKGKPIDHALHMTHLLERLKEMGQERPRAWFLSIETVNGTTKVSAIYKVGVKKKPPPADVGSTRRSRDDRPDDDDD